MCETRWIENHDGLLKFKDMFGAIIEAFEELESDQDNETSTKASNYLKSLITSDFIVSLLITSELFSLTLPLCTKLQSPSQDITSAIDHIENVVLVMKDLRLNIDKMFSKLFETAKNILHSMNEEIKLPRIICVDKGRDTELNKDPMQYYKITIAISFLDDIIGQLESRFVSHKYILTNLSMLIPSVLLKKQKDYKNFKTEYKLYSHIVDEELIHSEFIVWKKKWEKEE